MNNLLRYLKSNNSYYLSTAIISSVEAQEEFDELLDGLKNQGIDIDTEALRNISTELKIALGGVWDFPLELDRWL